MIGRRTLRAHATSRIGPLRLGLHAERLRGGGQADVLGLTLRLDRVGERHVHRCRENEVLRDVHALRTPPPRTDLVGRRSERLGGVGLVPLGFEIGLGTSGAPVFDDSGRVAGVALAILAERRSATAAYDQYKDTGMGLMLPASAFCGALSAQRAARPTLVERQGGGPLPARSISAR